MTQRRLDELTRVIRHATPKDALFVRHLQKIHANSIGFIPDAATAKYIELGGISIALENDEPAGMLLGREALRWNVACRPIFQAAVDFSAQRRHLGLALVERTAAAAREAGQLALQACCREGLEANDFWRAAGFAEICRLDPQNARRQAVICWRLSLVTFPLPKWFHMPPPVAGWRARRTRTES